MKSVDMMMVKKKEKEKKRRRKKKKGNNSNTNNAGNNSSSSNSNNNNKLKIFKDYNKSEKKKKIPFGWFRGNSVSNTNKIKQNKLQ